MRSLLPVIAVYLALSSFAVSLAVTLAGPPSDTATGTPAPAPAKPSGTPMGTSSDGDAAAKHAKRTACLKNAKAKKLVGAQKTAFVKDCVGPP
jgi:hypothetical protein